jgi:hypothetical protein
MMAGVPKLFAIALLAAAACGGRLLLTDSDSGSDEDVAGQENARGSSGAKGSQNSPVVNGGAAQQNPSVCQPPTGVGFCVRCADGTMVCN